MNNRTDLGKTKRCVVKVGSALLTDDGMGLNAGFVSSVVDQIAALNARGFNVVLVSSGAIAVGLSQLNITTRPAQIRRLQAAAAVGQAGLIRAYDKAIAPHGIAIAQVLLTHADIANRERYLNARNTLTSLLNLGVVPIVNENDTVSTDEIRFGDNDRLAALVANLIDAELMLLLTDQEGLFSADPRQDSRAQLIHQARADDPSLKPLATGGSSVGRGGMITKLEAADFASRSGCATVIAHGKEVDVMSRVIAGEEIGTLLVPSAKISSKKQWLANQMRPEGQLILDAGASARVQNDGVSLLPVGVQEVHGEFARGALVSMLGPDHREFARGISNYSADDARELAGKNSEHIRLTHGPLAVTELVHRDNLVVLSASNDV